MQIRPHQGMTIDGFTLAECLHKGGFATIWDVTHPDHHAAMIMKVPTILDGDDGPTIVGFEVEQMIMPRLAGVHVPRVIGQGDFAVMPYIVTERIPGTSMLPMFKSAPLPISDVIELSARLAEAVHDLHRQHERPPRHSQHRPRQRRLELHAQRRLQRHRQLHRDRDRRRWGHHRTADHRHRGPAGGHNR